MSLNDHNAKRWANRTLAAMSLEEKIGQMLMADFAAVFTNEDHENRRRIGRLIKEQHIGGVVLAGGSVYEIAILTNELQGMANTPLFVNADAETGSTFWRPWNRVRGRGPDLPEFLTGGGTQLPGFMAIGATRREGYAENAGRITAMEARAIGIHWINSPLVDVNTNPRNPIINTRAFSDEPEFVARLGAAYVRGLQSAGVIATLKHYPGHGATSEDTHIELPHLPFDRQRLDEIEFVPFKAGIAAGAKAIMTCHVALPNVDPTGRPATLSKVLLTDILRRDLGFEGLIASDALTMQGITDYFGPDEAVVLAVQAGVDVLLIPWDTAATHRRLVHAVNEGEIEREAIDQSVYRILTAKAELGLHQSRTVSLDQIAKVVNAPESAQFAEKVAAAAVTLLEQDSQTLPLRSACTPRVLNVVVSNSADDSEGRYLRAALAAAGLKVESARLEANADQSLIDKIKAAIRETDVIVLGLNLSVGAWKGPLHLPPQTFELINFARELNKPVVAVSYADPYVFEHIRDVAACLCAYSSGKLMEEAVAKAMLGEFEMVGKLPVKIPGRC